tara:strand:+ start:8776 stop:9204 length:429 start_codon:yes stop_codon:yes gene_type:complete
MYKELKNLYRFSLIVIKDFINKIFLSNILLIMPYQIKKVGKKYKLFKIKEKTFVNKEYNSKESAVKAGMAMMRYRKEKPVLKGNKLLNANKMKKELTKEQKETLKEHSKHHSKKHMKMMRDMMKEGKTFRQAHNRAKKLVGN